MRSVVLLFLAVIVTGCAEKHRVSAETSAALPPKSAKPDYNWVIPASCIIGGVADKTQCKAVSATEAVCTSIIVRYGCVRPAPVAIPSPDTETK